MPSRAEPPDSGLETRSLLGVVVLAAGRGTRLGARKALYELGGEPLIAHVLRSLEEALSALDLSAAVAVVCGDDAALVAAEPRAAARTPARIALRIVPNEAPERERTHSLRLGAHALPAAGPLLIWPVDVPLVASASVRALLAAPIGPRSFRVPCCAERGGHPVLLGVELRSEIESLDDRATLRELRERDDVVRERIAVDDEGVLLDLDTPADAARATALLARRRSGAPQRPR
jgi:CTP:molybdopterin cytidylyltransferase MocA